MCRLFRYKTTLKPNWAARMAATYPPENETDDNNCEIPLSHEYAFVHLNFRVGDEKDLEAVLNMH